MIDQLDSEPVRVQIQDFIEAPLILSASSFLSDSVLDVDLIALFNEQCRQSAIHNSRRNLGLNDNSAVEQHVFTDGKRHLIPIQRHSFVEDASGYSSHTLRSGQRHKHAQDGSHEYEKGVEKQQDGFDFSEFQGEDAPMFEKMGSIKKVNPALHAARKRAKSFRGLMHK